MIIQKGMAPCLEDQRVCVAHSSLQSDSARRHRRQSKMGIPLVGCTDIDHVKNISCRFLID